MAQQNEKPFPLGMVRSLDFARRLAKAQHPVPTNLPVAELLEVGERMSHLYLGSGRRQTRADFEAFLESKGATFIERDVMMGADDQPVLVGSAPNHFALYGHHSLFDLAVSYGHMVLHYPQFDGQGEAPILYVPRYERGDKVLERAHWEAIQFGASFLMPVPVFRAVWSEAGGDVSKVKRRLWDYDLSNSHITRWATRHGLLEKTPQEENAPKP